VHIGFVYHTSKYLFVNIQCFDLCGFSLIFLHFLIGMDGDRIPLTFIDIAQLVWESENYHLLWLSPWQPLCS